jgi:hypothetical protein
MALLDISNGAFGSIVKSVILLPLLAVLLVSIVQLSDPAGYNTDR